MAMVRINQKNYEVPELTFRHSKMMEQMGLPVEGMLSRNYLFSAVSAFTAIVAKCDPDQADHLVEQHILGGSGLEDIYSAYAAAIQESRFFRKLLHLDEQEKEPKKKSSAKTEPRLSEEEV